MDSKRYLAAILVFVAIDLLFTGVSVVSARPGEAVGGLRPIYAIPPKLLQLAAVGLVVGVISVIVLRNLDLGLVALAVVLTPLLDIDHLPVFLRIPQPIRPSHSLLFMLTVGVVVYLLLRRADVALMTSSSIMIHLAADESGFPLLSPLSYKLYTFGATGDVFLVSAAISVALLAGYVAKRKSRAALVQPRKGETSSPNSIKPDIK